MTSFRLLSARLAVVAAVAAAGLSGPLHAQFLLKDGQGLAGAPEPVPEVGRDGERTAPMQKLPEVKVEGELDPLSEADRKLRRQKKALPGLGTEEERNLNRLEKLREWYDALPSDPNQLSAEQKAFLEEQRDFDVKPDRRPGVPNGVERRNPADYRDPIGIVTP
jgi:hypothetical protein